MFRRIENILFERDRQAFEKLRLETERFSAEYCGKNIIQDDIFNIAENYTRRCNLPFELLRYRIDDAEFCACTFIRANRIFCLVNGSLPLSKQIFATAHELYHIVCYCRGEEQWLRTSGSMLLAETIDEDAAAEEDMEANAFAGLLLAPKAQITEQVRIYGLQGQEADISSIIMLMDIFAIPYKAMVLRLFEESIITAEEAEQLFTAKQGEVDEEIRVTGKARRWQTAPLDTEKYGSLLENMKYLEQTDAIQRERLEADRRKLESILETRRSH